MSNSNNHEMIIKAGQTERHYWYELWYYRELFYFLAWRDILVKYKQTLLGITWAVIRPVLTMIILTIVFGKLAKLPSNGVPYPILVFSAILPWQLFSTAFTEIGNSFIGRSNLITKIYFPRLIIPSSVIIVSLIDFTISFFILVGMMFWYGFYPEWRILTLPLFLLIACATVLGAGLWVATLNVKYRDMRIIIPFIVQFGLYISPVGFSSNIIPDKWRLLYSINPMVGVIDGFRWAILGSTTHIYWPSYLLSNSLVIILLITGLIYFRRNEKTFADII